MDFSICGILGQFCGDTSQDIEKRFSASFQGVENQTFPIKNLALKIYILSFAKLAIFAKRNKKSCFIIFIDV